MDVYVDVDVDVDVCICVCFSFPVDKKCEGSVKSRTVKTHAFIRFISFYVLCVQVNLILAFIQFIFMRCTC